jgi:hypothetical protein
MSGTVHRYRLVPKHFIQRENRNDLRNEIDKLAWYWATAWRHQIEVVDRCCIGWRWLGSSPPCLSWSCPSTQVYFSIIQYYQNRTKMSATATGCAAVVHQGEASRVRLVDLLSAGYLSSHAGASTLFGTWATCHELLDTDLPQAC